MIETSNVDDRTTRRGRYLFVWNGAHTVNVFRGAHNIDCFSIGDFALTQASVQEVTDAVNAWWEACRS